MNLPPGLVTAVMLKASSLPRGSHLQEFVRWLLTLLFQLTDLLAHGGDLLRELGRVLLLPPHDLLVQLCKLAQEELLLSLHELVQLLDFGHDLLPLRFYPFLQKMHARERQGEIAWGKLQQSRSNVLTLGATQPLIHKFQ